VREIVLADNERFRSVHIDASQIAARKLAINFDYTVAGAIFPARPRLHEAQTSLDTDVRIRGVKVPVDAINKFVALPEGWMRGQMEKFNVDLAAWPARRRLGMEALPLNSLISTRNKRRSIAEYFKSRQKTAVATMQSADITRDQNQFHLRGSAELPRNIRDFGRAPGNSGTGRDFARFGAGVTAGMPQKISGAAEISGKLNIKDSIVNGEFAVTAPSLGFQDGRCEGFQCRDQTLEENAASRLRQTLV